MESIGFIYKTTCLINGKIYIGRHEGKENDNYLGSGILFTNALKKYGKENFKREILRRCYSQHELEIWEYFYIKVLKSQNPEVGYNIADGDVNSSRGNPARRPEVREKMKESAKIRFCNPENNPMYGKHHSEEARRKIAEKRLGISWTDEQRKKMSEQRKGKKRNKPFSEETRRKMSESAKRRMANPENNPMYGDHRFAGENNPMYGRRHSEETKKHWSEIRKGVKLSEETKLKMSLAHKKN